MTVALGRGNSRYVHRLVAAAFIGPCPEGLEVRHWNDDPSYNEWGNIIYGTRSENNRDKKWNTGQSNFVLSISDIRDVKRRIAAGERYASIAWDFAISVSQVCGIKQGLSHPDV